MIASTRTLVSRGWFVLVGAGFLGPVSAQTTYYQLPPPRAASQPASRPSTYYQTGASRRSLTEAAASPSYRPALRARRAQQMRAPPPQKPWQSRRPAFDCPGRFVVRCPDGRLIRYECHCATDVLRPVQPVRTTTLSPRVTPWRRVRYGGRCGD